MGRGANALAVALGTGLGVGYSPIAPGTAGSALGVAVAAGAVAARVPAIAVAFLLFPFGVWAAGVCARRYGAHDHGRIVVDEIVGQLIALATFPARPGWLIAGFLLFRFFDIVKPFPAGRIDRSWRTPLGVMVDDVVAGLYANLALQLVRAAAGA